MRNPAESAAEPEVRMRPVPPVPPHQTAIAPPLAGVAHAPQAGRDARADIIRKTRSAWWPALG